jgi:hypothetical protein
MSSEGGQVNSTILVCVFGTEASSGMKIRHGEDKDFLTELGVT